MLASDASTDGSTMAVFSATALYALPAPSGRWIAGSMCLVNRQSCARDQANNVINDACGEAEAACAREPTRVNATVGGTPCEPTLPFQSCDWDTFPHLLGRVVHMPQGYLNDDYPFPCSAGMLGSISTAHQSTSLCAGFTPAGTFQPIATGTVPKICSPGYYCPAGSVAPLPCPGGTRSNTALDVMASATDFIVCAAGSACPIGSASETPVLVW
jgi:hypothetical protein